MPTQQPPTLQDILDERQQDEFVGREAYLARFHDNIRLAFDDPRRRFVFDVYGQAGVGKTWLLRQMRRIAEEHGLYTAWSDDAQQDVPAVMGTFANQLAAQDLPLKSFAERYRAYRQQRKELETDPEAPKGLPVFLGKVLTRAGLTLAKQIPVGGLLIELLDQEGLADQVGQWVDYITRKVTNKDEVHLVLDPLAVLTPLFLDDLRKRVKKGKQVVLFFDAYEHTGEFLDPWLRALLEGRYGEVPASITFVIAGRDALDRTAWAAYERLVERMPLAPFTDEELRVYLERKGITDEETVALIRRLSGNLPLLVATLAGDGNIPTNVEAITSETAVDLFLQRAPDAQHREAALNASLPRRLNRDIFRLIVQAENAEDLFTWLVGRPFVQETPRGWVYHDVVRRQMLHHKRRESPDEWQALHEKLAAYYEEHRDALDVPESERWRHPAWQEYALEALYHRLCRAPTESLAAALNAFMAALDEHANVALRWAETIQQAGEDAEDAVVREWGERLTRVLTAERETRHAEAVEVFTRLMEFPDLEKSWRFLAHLQRGLAYQALGQWDAARADFTKAARLRRKDPRPYLYRGEVYLQEGDLAEALTDLSRAIALDPHNVQAHYLRGTVHLRRKRYKTALKDFDAVLEVQPEHARALAARGEALRHLKRFEEALEALNRAAKLLPNDPQVLAARGDVLLHMGRARDAVADFSLALKQRPDDPWLLARRGEAYRLLGYYPAALADLNRAISLNPKDAWAIASRGELYRSMGEYEKALVDLSKALRLNPRDVWARVSRGIAYLHLGQPREALKDFNTALEKRPDDPWILANRAEAYRRLKQLSRAIRDITKAIKQAPDEDWYLYTRALVYLTYSKRKLAKAHRDLKAAIALAEKRYQENPEDWANTLNLALYYLALSDEARAEALYQEALRNGATPYHIRAALDDVRALTATIADLLDMEAVERMQAGDL